MPYIPNAHRGDPKNILHFWNQIPDGSLLQQGVNWYRAENIFLGFWAEELSLPLNIVCAVVAALSPMTEYGENLAAAESLLFGKPAAYRGLTSNWTRAQLILDERNPAFLAGPKVLSFYANLAHPDLVGPVTIDRHALAIWLGLKRSQSLTCSPRTYEIVAKDYREAAKQIRLQPQELQGATWLYWKHTH